MRRRSLAMLAVLAVLAGASVRKQSSLSAPAMFWLGRDGDPDKD